ncbi:hypothetical protein Hanom_Chr06g00490761 [Helianthus anomalus]
MVASYDSKSHGEVSNLLVLLKVSTHNIEKVEVVKDNVVQIDFYECMHATISRRPRAKSSVDFQDNGGPIILEDESTDINYVMCAKIWNKKLPFDPGGTYLKSKELTHKVGLFRCVVLIITKMNRVDVPFDPGGFVRRQNSRTSFSEDGENDAGAYEHILYFYLKFEFPILSFSLL